LLLFTNLYTAFPPPSALTADLPFSSLSFLCAAGYGNQIPQYEFGRFVACCVMVFGALFLSMPLAIIGA
jgi:hypothetical protein